MKQSRSLRSRPILVARLAVAGMSLAVVLLGALAVWAALTIESGARGLTEAGVQTSDHLRAVQALSVVDTQSDVLEDEVVAEEVRKLRAAQRVLDNALCRMEHGGVAESRLIAQRAKPVAAELRPLIDAFLKAPRGGDGAETAAAEENMEVVMEYLQIVLNDLDHDPSQALTERLRAVNDSEETVGWAAFILVPLGLLSVAVCAQLLSRYRRKTEATMRSAMQTTAREARTDQLTGLVNRRGLSEELECRVDTATYQPTMLVLDLDGFKDVNDTYGHHVGDRLLTEVAKRLRDCLRAQDVLARLGGDEFALLVVDAPVEAGERTAERIITALSEPFHVDDLALDIEASIGIATAESGQDMTVVVQHADAAMYAAKQNRIGYSRYDAHQAPATASRLTLLGGLRHALAEGEIELYYQPKIAVSTGQVIGVEALARWNHPTRGVISPAEFIPVLESTSLMQPFTTYVLRSALAQQRCWLDTGRHVPVAINVSTRSLLDRTFPETVEQALAEAGVPGHLLCIEITEHTIMTDAQGAGQVLKRIKELGVRVSIDDFGTGYSSMAYLKTLPMDEIKIDREFVAGMVTHHSNHALVGAVVGLGHNLGLAVVAEGVEDAQTLSALHELGCDVAQGYHFARPLPGYAITAYLATHAVRVESTPITNAT